MQRSLSNGLMIMVNITNPMGVNLINIFFLDNLENINIQFVYEFNLKCLKIATKQLLDT